MIHRLGRQRLRLVADSHLRPDQPAEVAAAAAHVDALDAADTDALVVLGDLVDAWAGPGCWSEAGFEPLLSAFERLRQRGVGLWLLRGNRDVLFEAGDLEPFGGRLADRLVVETGRSVLLLSHGDEYCLRDKPYQRLRRALRRRPLRWLLRGLPLRLRLRLAARMRGASVAAVSRKPLESMALVDEAVSAALAEQGAAEAVIGHLHREERRTLPCGRTLRVLPAWSPERPPAPI